jgi:hypothetical protein
MPISKRRNKKVFLWSLLLLVSIAPTNVFAQKNIYENVNFERLSQHHKLLAILPFSSQVNLSTNIDTNTKTSLEINEGEAVQDALEFYFLKIKKRKKFSVEFQNVEKTNTLLSKNNIDHTNIDLFTTKELCEILGVDVIITGNIALNVLLSKGLNDDDFSLIDYFLGKSFGRIAIKLSDGNSGKLLWKYEKDIDRKTGKNTKDLIDAMMRAAGRKFPYEKED